MPVRSLFALSTFRAGFFVFSLYQVALLAVGFVVFLAVNRVNRFLILTVGTLH
jgi:hypothetical protein